MVLYDTSEFLLVIFTCLMILAGVYLINKEQIKRR